MPNIKAHPGDTVTLYVPGGGLTYGTAGSIWTVNGPDSSYAPNDNNPRGWTVTENGGDNPVSLTVYIPLDAPLGLDYNCYYNYVLGASYLGIVSEHFDIVAPPKIIQSSPISQDSLICNFVVRIPVTINITSQDSLRVRFGNKDCNWTIKNNTCYGWTLQTDLC